MLLDATGPVSRALRKSDSFIPRPIDSHIKPPYVGDMVSSTGCDDAQREQLEKRAEGLVCA